ncbi:MAG: hypothetical protein HAW67_01375 [Endozoicomonadaceae bacterium]|nr:hypothetical protein [Endozoicomonadaceae bacterium]
MNSFNGKDAKHDNKRKDLPRLPSSRIKSEADADVMSLLYGLGSVKESKLAMIVSAAAFALENDIEFLNFLDKKNQDE